MSKKADEKDKTAQQAAAVPEKSITKNENEGAASAELGQEQKSPAPKTTADTAPGAAPEVPEPEIGDADALKSLDDLAMAYRVPSWQQAALVRFMGWAPGKRVTDSEYAESLDALTSRRMGGGRKE